MPTNLVPKNTGSGSLGTDSKRWESINAVTGSIDHINPLMDSLYVRGNITASGGIKADSFQSVTGGTGIDFSDDVNISGDISLNNNLTFTEHITIGSNRASTIGGYVNVAIGKDALLRNTSNNNQIAIGARALMSGSGGNTYKNIGIGLDAGSQIGNNPTGASSDLQVGYYNVMIGDLAAGKLRLGHTNVAIGKGAMYGNDSYLPAHDAGANYKPSENVAIGYHSMYDIEGGSQNVALGYRALGYNTFGCNNIALGFYAGKSIISGSSISTLSKLSGNNIMIGSGSDVQNSSDYNSIAIGAGAAGKGSNTVVIGDMSITDNYFTGNIIADGDISASGNVYVGDGNIANGDISVTGDVMIGYPNSSNSQPGVVFKDSVGQSYIRMNGGRLRMQNNHEIGSLADILLTTYNFSNAIYIDDSAEAVGIGTNSPSKTLTVSGSISASGNLYIGDQHFTAANITTLKQGNTLKSISLGNTHPDLYAGDGVFDRIFLTGSISASIISASGNIIGNDLAIKGNITASGNISASGDLYGNDLNVSGTISASSHLYVVGNLYGDGNIYLRGNTPRVDFGGLDYIYKTPADIGIFRNNTKIVAVTDIGLNITGNITATDLIIGKSTNTVHNSSDYASILGGKDNTIGINADYSGIFGGQDNIVSHSNAFILGSNITSTQANTTYTENIIADGNISASGDLYVDDITADVITTTGNIESDGGRIMVSDSNASYGTLAQLYADGPNSASYFDMKRASADGQSQLIKIRLHSSGSSYFNDTGPLILGSDAAHLFNHSYYPGVQLHVIGDTRLMGDLLTIGDVSFLGDTTFGNSITDQHTFTGHITASGNISVGGNISASGDLYGRNISATGGIAASYINVDGSVMSYLDNCFIGQRTPAILLKTQGLSIYGNTILGNNTTFPTIDLRPNDANPTVNVFGDLAATGKISASGGLYAKSASFSNLATSDVGISTGTLYTQLGSELGLGSITASIATKKFVLIK